MKKTFFFVLVFSILTCVFANANQKQVVTNGEKFTFISENTSTTGFTFNYEGVIDFAKKNSGDNAKKVAAFKGMGIAGVVVLAISAVLVLSGAVMIGVGWYLSGGLYGLSYSSLGSLTSLGTGVYLMWGGYALVGIFSTFFVIGLALAIVGFALSSYYSKKAGLFFENKPELGASS